MRSGIFAAAIASGVALATVPAISADFGGDCCTDLEERVAELEATTVRKGNRKVSLTLYGQVNQAVMFWDDGTEDNIYVVNNKTSTSLFGFEGNAAINSEWSAGFRLEIETATANSDFVDQGFAGPPNNIVGVADEGRTALVLRHANWYLDSKRLGRITVGQQSNSTDNIAEFDLSRTSAVSLSSVETWNEGFFLKNANNGNGILFPGVIGVAANAQFTVMGDLFRGNFDGGRGNLVRYDSPVIAGFILSVDWGEDDDWAVGLRYAGEFGAIRVVGGIGYHSGKIVDTDNIVVLVGGANAFPDHEELVGSFSVLHQPSGAFFTFAAGGRNWIDGTGVAGIEFSDEKYIYLKSGLVRRFFTLGDTSIYGEYYKIWDVGLEFTTPAGAALFGDRFQEEAQAVGFGVVQHIDAAAMEVYLAYRHYWADDVTDLLLFQDNEVRMDMVMGGARIKF